MRSLIDRLADGAQEVGLIASDVVEMQAKGLYNIGVQAGTGLAGVGSTLGTKAALAVHGTGSPVEKGIAAGISADTVRRYQADAPSAEFTPESKLGKATVGLVDKYAGEKLRELGTTYEGTIHQAGQNVSEATGSEFLGAAMKGSYGALLTYLDLYSPTAQKPKLKTEIISARVDVDKSMDAIKRLKAGEDRETVFQDTGIYVDTRTGEVLHEILDGKAQLDALPPRQGLSRRSTLGNMLQHSELFDLYPELADYKVEVHWKPHSDYAGQINNNTRTVTVWVGATDRTSAHAELRDTIFHEVQHGVQYLDNRKSIGASMDTIEQSRKGWFDGVTQAIKDARLVNSSSESLDKVYKVLSSYKSYLLNKGEYEARVAESRQWRTSRKSATYGPVVPDQEVPAGGIAVRNEETVLGSSQLGMVTWEKMLEDNPVLWGDRTAIAIMLSDYKHLARLFDEAAVRDGEASDLASWESYTKQVAEDLTDKYSAMKPEDALPKDKVILNNQEMSVTDTGELAIN